MRHILVAALSLSCTWIAACDYEDVNPSGAWNGKKVFLSPAHHGGYNNPPAPNFGCYNYNENTGALNIARDAAAVAGGLAGMGYKVRIGRRDRVNNKNNSNAWGSTAHIPIHSNAAGNSGGWDCSYPYNLNQGWSGSEVYHYPGSTNGLKLAQEISPYVNQLSPGRGSDDIRTNSSWTELAGTTMPAAYIEMAYHTFSPDTTSMRDNVTWWGSAIAVGIDKGIDRF